jgi:hypothetical protein
VTAFGLPAYGMGCAGIGNLYSPVSDCEARDTVAAAWHAGIRYFDTAPHYGFGLSECRLGAALADIDGTGEAIVSTKVGRLLDPIDGCARERHGFVDAAAFEPRFDYRGEAIRRSFEESLARLRRDRIDILLAISARSPTARTVTGTCATSWTAAIPRCLRSAIKAPFERSASASTRPQSASTCSTASSSTSSSSPDGSPFSTRAHWIACCRAVSTQEQG